MSFNLLKKANLIKILPWMFWLTLLILNAVMGNADPTVPPPGFM